MLRSNSAEVMQQDIPICAWAPQAQRPVSWRGLAPFYLGFFRDEVGVGGSAQAHCARLQDATYRGALQLRKATLGN